jgi:hypothetical protein
VKIPSIGRYRRRVRIGALVTILTLLVALGAAGGAGAAPGASSKWVNHDADNWGGWSDPANPGFATNPGGCDPIDPAQCLLPYPNDWFTRHDPTSATGRRLELSLAGMPRNAEGKPVEPPEWNRSDGFSAGAQILTVVPGMTRNADLVPSGLPPATDLAMNEPANNPDPGVILLDADTGRVWPVWVEVDQYTQEAGVLPAGAVGHVQQDLMIHPAMNLLDGHRYIVALRHLHQDGLQNQAPPPGAFKAYRDGTASPTDPRTAHMAGIFADLAEAGWSTSNLYLAWDFTTASTKNVTGRLLHIRDDAFSQLGQTAKDSARGRITPTSSAPAFTVNSVTDYTPSQNQNVARQITGTFTVPCYLAPSCAPPVKCATLTAPTPIGTPFNDCPTPSQFVLDPTNPDTVPSQVPGQTYQATFICNVGRNAFANHQLVRPVEYGHGLFGGASEVNVAPQEEMANQFGMMYCASDWLGFDTSDVPDAALAIHDLSRFPILADRSQQGQLDFLYLQRLMVHRQGFASNPAFQYPDHTSFIDRSGVFYDGNSQGGIYGGTVCAVSIDAKRCVLGVNGMDYSILLPRSTDYVASRPLTAFNPLTFNPTDPTAEIGFSGVLDFFYPDQSQRLLLFDLIQTLWDRADPDGYATHMTASAEGGLLPATPDHHVLMQIAWGDHQVANITAEDEARTIRAASIDPPLVASRLSGSNDPGGAYAYKPTSPFWDIPAITSFPYDGSAIVLFDAGPVGADQYGTEPPPPSDVPNRTGGDPHEAPRRACAAQQQKAPFLAVGGVVTEPLQPNGPLPPPYFAGGWQGTCTNP